MKKISFLLLIVLLTIACQQNHKKTEYKDVVLSGTVKNAPQPALILKNVTGKPVDTLALDKTGHFVDTLTLPKGYYKLNVGEQYTWAYFKPGDQLQIDIDYKDFDKTLTYKGKGAKRNNYLAQKMLKGIDLKPKMSYKYYGQLDEKAFLQLQDSIDKVYNELLKQVDEPDFVNLEQLRNKARKADYLSQYQMVRRYITHDKNFKVSGNYPNPYKGIDINDETLNLIPQGRDAVLGYLYYEQEQEGKQGSDPIAMLERIEKDVKNSKMKEALAYNNAKYQLMYTDSLDQYYQLFTKLVKNPEYVSEIKQKYDNIKAMLPGTPSPDFTAYDVNGKAYHLKDFAGKPLYIDLWATWCSPCRAEIPHLEKLKKAYKNKPINFLSLDVYDNKEKWKQMIQQQKMGGWQLISTDKDMPFLKKYVVDGIPRFILLDADGKIVDANAPRPSNPKLKDLLDKTIKK